MDLAKQSAMQAQHIIVKTIETGSPQRGAGFILLIAILKAESLFFD